MAFAKVYYIDMEGRAMAALSPHVLTINIVNNWLTQGRLSEVACDMGEYP